MAPASVAAVCVTPLAAPVVVVANVFTPDPAAATFTAAPRPAPVSAIFPL